MALLDNPWLGLIVFDRESRVVQANRAAEDFLDMPPGSLAGLHINDIHQAVRGTLLFLYNRAMRERVPVKFEKLFLPNKNLKFSLYPDEEGVIATVEDISREWATNEAGRIALLTVNSLPDAVFITRTTGRIINVNDRACDYSGYTKEELFGSQISGLLPELDIGQHRSADRSDRKREMRSVMESELQRKDGRKLPVEVSVSEKKMYGNMQYLIIARNITERRQAENELVAARQQAELYLDLMGHDINNMHQIAMGYLEIVEDMMPMDDPRREYIEKPVEVLQRSAQLIKNVRKLQRLNEGVFRSMDIDVCEVLESVQKEFGAVPGKPIRLNMNGCKGCHVLANELLHDVFANLASNAIKHTGEKADICIGIDIMDNNGSRYCRVSVEDNGPGIPDDFKEKIFNRMLKGTSKAKGMGLGLYLVKSLVESYGGRVRVEDRVPGDHTKGARFVVMLPAIGK